MAKILLVEDDNMLQKALEEYLTDDNFEVVCAPNGEEGIRKAIQDKPDLILLDLILPKKNGYEVIEELKANESTKKIPIVLLTNLEGIHDVQKALDLGATTYLTKSDYKLEEIAKKVRTILGIN